MKNGVHTVKDNRAKLTKLLGVAQNKQVLVGIPSSGGMGEAPIGSNEREAEAPGEPAPHITNAVIGYINEFGAPEMNIPPRPFLIPGIKSVQAELNERFRKAGMALLSDDRDEMIKQLHDAGLTAQLAVRMKIKQGPFKELAASTIAARRRRGHTSEKPLQESGQLRNSVSYVLRDKQ